VDQFEQAVLAYVCGQPDRFASWQFSIAWDGLRGGSCPDFVVLDYGDQTVT
jgi:hypothetical protein